MDVRERRMRKIATLHKSNGTAPRRDMAYTCTNRCYLLPLLEMTQLQVSSAIDCYPRKTNDSNFVEGHVQGTGAWQQGTREMSSLLAKDVFPKTTTAFEAHFKAQSSTTGRQIKPGSPQS